jgi:hypothetical protein
MALGSDLRARFFARIAGLGVGLCALLQPAGAFAFKEPGHRVIERVAYQRLIDAGSAEVLAKLARAGALRGALPPAGAKDPNLDPNDYIGMKIGDLNVQGIWVGSHIPDHSFDRQLQSYGQCFHFNARASDATTAEALEKTREGHVVSIGVPQGMVHDAYLRCVSLMDVLVRGIIADPVDADRRNKGLYTLIHMLADSFSDAHTARTKDWRILYVKPWRLRAWVPNLWPWNWGQYSWQEFVTDNHHGVMDPRDWDFVNDTPDCQALKEDPGKLPADCLSPVANRAVDAVVDLLVLVSTYVEHPPLRDSGAMTAQGFESAWNTFKKAHFSHYYDVYTPLADPSLPHADLVSRSNREEEHEAKTAVLGFAFDLQASTDNVWLEGTLLRWADGSEEEELEMSQYLTQTVQLRLPLETLDGQRPLGIAYELGFQVPSNLVEQREFLLKLGLRARAGYGVSRISERETRHTFEFGLAGLSLDAVVMDKLWLGVIFPRVVYRLDTWGKETFDTSWSVKAGYAF